jgi:hypothetical protein
MISQLLSAKGLQGMIDQVVYAKLQAEKRVTFEYRNLLYNMFHDVVAGTPQWSGNLATNWGIEVAGAPGVRYREHPGYLHTYYGRIAVQKMGNDPAVRETLDRELPKLNNLKWNSKVTFINRTPYAADVQAGVGPNGLPIRQVNLDAAGQVIMLNGIKVKYQNQYGVTIN